jgi:histidyl-tRNA synthetase
MSKMDLQPVRGTRDILDKAASLHNYVIETARNIVTTYGYVDILTPIFECSEVFHRTLGETSDVVSKETYTFIDRDTSSLTLRPEFTAGVVRAFISNGLTQSTPLKLFTSGPVFRHERPQRARYRQFHQINCELLGAAEPSADAETIAMAASILKACGIFDQVKLEINSIGDVESRSRHREALTQYFSKFESELSEDSKRRLVTNPLRILDSKDAEDQKIVAGAPNIEDYLNEASATHYRKILSFLDQMGIHYTKNSKLVRGLDYYTHTVFEFTTANLGAQATVLAGGRYDGLVELMGGPHTPAIGFAAGVERLCELMSNELRLEKEVKFALIPIGEAAEDYAVPFAQSLRDSGMVVLMEYKGNPGKRFKKADKQEADFAIVIGEEELAQGKCKIKNLKTGEELEAALRAGEIKKVAI